MDFYKGYEDFMEFSSATKENAFGAQMLALCERRFDNIEDAVIQLTEGLDELGFDVDEDGVIGLMTGEVAPSEELLEAVIGLAETESEALRLVNAAADTHEYLAEMIEAGEVDIEAEDEDEDYEGYEEDEVEEEAEETSAYDYDYENEEGAEEEEEEDLAVALYSRQVIEDALNDLSDVADQMMFSESQGLMTPHIKQLLFGKNDRNRYVNFSAVCDEEGYTPEEYIKCIEFSLNLLSELGSVDSAYFSAYVDEEVADDNEISFSRRTNTSHLSETEVETQASEMLKLLDL